MISLLFKTGESLTCPVNRHTSPVPAAQSHSHMHTKAQTNPGEIFNRARQLALPLPSFIIPHLLVCLPACSLSSSVVSAVFPSFLFFCSSVQLFQLSLHPPVTRTYWVQLFADYFTFLLPFPSSEFGPRLYSCLRSVASGFLPSYLTVVRFPRFPASPGFIWLSFFFFSNPCLSPPTTTSGSVFVSERIHYPPPSSHLLSSLPGALSIPLSPLSPHAPALYSLT